MMDGKTSGKGVALLAAIGRKPKDGAESDKGMDGGDEAAPMDDKYSMACDDLASDLGVPEEKRGTFAASFRAAVKAAQEPEESDEADSGPAMGDGMRSLGM